MALRVLQLNTWNVEGPWVARLGEMVALVRQHRPDVLTLQEVVAGDDGRSSAHILADQLTSAGPHRWSVAHASVPFPDEVLGVPDGSTWGVAVASRWPIEAQHWRVLSDGHASMWLALHARTNGLDVFSTHLTPARHDGVWRERQVREVDSFVRAHRSATSPLPAVIGGDFNAEPDAAEIRFLTGRQSLEGASTYYQDAWAVAGDGSPGHTWVNDNPFAAPLHLHAARVDYVFVGDHYPLNAPAGPGEPPGDGRGKVTRCEVVGHPPLTGIYASDHLGVLCDVAWPGEMQAGYQRGIPVGSPRGDL
jgi:endonuclease/exonuclease/phosphatase family metal-dependent hydrolase